MDDLSLDSDGGEVDRDECDESTLASTFPSTYREVASVGVAMEKVYVLDLARVGDQACAGLDSGKISLHSLETLARSSSLTGHSKPVTGVVGSPAGSSTLYSCSQDQTVRVWDLRKPGGSVAVLKDTSGGTGQDKSRKGPPGKNEGRSLQCLSLSSDDHTVVAGTEQVQFQIHQKHVYFLLPRWALTVFSYSGTAANQGNCREATGRVTMMM